MLTRDFTWSRNLSQEFAVSRSRPAWVAVVIGREKKNFCYFHRCEKTVERKPVHVIVSGFGMLARTGTFFVPLSLRSRPVRGCRPAYCRSKTAGLSPIGLRGASEKCAKGFTTFHTPYTVFPQAQILCSFALKCQFSRGFSIYF